MEQRHVDNVLAAQLAKTRVSVSITQLKLCTAFSLTIFAKRLSLVAIYFKRN